MSKLEDSEGEAISDVESTFNTLGMSIRKSATEFKDFSTIIDELNGKWSSFNDLEKSAIAKSLAGTRQRENFLVLMDNLDQVNELQQKVAESAGSAEKKFSDAFGESTEAKINKFKNSVQQFWIGALDSNTINSFIELGTKVVNILQAVSDSSTGTKVALLALTPVLILFAFHLKAVILDIATAPTQVTALNAVLKLFFGTAVTGTSILAGLKGVLTTLKASFVALFATPAGWAILLGIGAIALATTIIIDHIKHQKQLKEQLEANTESYKNLTQAIKEADFETQKNESTGLQKQQDELQKLLKLRDELSTKRSGLDFEYDKTKYQDVSRQIKEIDDKIKDLNKVLGESGFHVNSLTGEVRELEVAKNNIQVDENIKKIKEETDARIQNAEQTTNLIDRYQQLAAITKRTSDEQNEMSNVARQLAGVMNGLTLITDANGNVTIQNANALEVQRTALGNVANSAVASANSQIEAESKLIKVIVSGTSITIGELQKRVEAYKAMLATASAGEMTFNEGDRIVRNIAKYEAIINAALAKISKLKYSSPSLPKVSVGSYTPPKSSSSGSSSSSSSDEPTPEEIEAENAEKVKQLRDDLVSAMKQKYEEDRDNELKILQEKEDAEVAYQQGRIKQLQDEINRLQDTSADERKKLEALKKELVAWGRDDSEYSKRQRETIQGQIEELEKQMKIKDLENQIKIEEEKQKAIEDSYEAQQEAINKKYEDLLDDKNAYAEADKLITESNQKKILDLLLKYQTQYGETGATLGKSFADAMLEEIQQGLKAKNDLIKATPSAPSSGSSSSSSSSNNSSSQPASRTYTVKKGDTLSGIAKKLGMSWEELYKKNKDIISNPNRIYVGQILRYAEGGLNYNTGLAWLDGSKSKPERILPPNVTKTFDDFVYNILPKFMNPKMPQIDKPYVIIPEGAVQNTFNVTNNTPWEVDNNSKNISQMFENSLHKAGVRLNLA